MSGKVDLPGYWDRDADQWVDGDKSEREYTEYTTMAAYVEDDYYRNQRATNLALYADEENGIVVTDVLKYEKWLKTVIVR